MTEDLVSGCRKILESLWDETWSHATKGDLQDALEEYDLIESVQRAINSKTKTYRYVLPSQLVAKLAAPALDCRCIQVARGGEGAFDARTVAHKVIVPFDQSNEGVLGNSPEPYVNNPLRVQEVSASFRSPQKNRQDWDHLCSVLGRVEREQNPSFTEAVFRQTLIEIFRRLSRVRVAYPAPMRISWQRCNDVIKTFLSVQSGGDRLLALASALFSVIGNRFRLFSEIRRSNITAADSATGLVADFECISREGKTVLVVEVKDRHLTINQMKSKIPSIRERQVSEVFFIAQQGIEKKDERDVAALVGREFTLGHNVYITDLISLCDIALALLGEEGRRAFLTEVGHQLDKYHSDIAHRRAWAKLLGEI